MISLGDPIIKSGTEDLAANNYPSEITITLAKTCLVSALQFDKIDAINSFIIEYEINSEKFLYKDNLLQEDVTVSLNFFVQNLFKMLQWTYKFFSHCF